MPSRESEVFVLRSYPYREADLIVSFFARDRGKLRGIARGVRRPKSRFGSSLERLAYSKLFYFQKDTLDLVRIDRAESVGPPTLLQADYATSVALDLIAESAEQLLPEHQPSDAEFRLLQVVIEEFWRGVRDESTTGNLEPWAQRALLYFLVWTIRLGGWLPSLDRCIESGEPIAADQPAFFDRARSGLFGPAFKNHDSWEMSPTARNLARSMLLSKPGDIDSAGWSELDAEPLRRFLVQRAESQIEGRLRSATALNGLPRAFSVRA